MAGNGGVLGGLCGGISEGPAGLCGVLRGSTEVSEGSDPMLVTLGNFSRRRKR